MAFGGALQTANYILNKVLSQPVHKMPSKFYILKKPSVVHFHICGCPTEARISNPELRKLILDFNF